MMRIHICFKNKKNYKNNHSNNNTHTTPKNPKNSTHHNITTTKRYIFTDIETVRDKVQERASKRTRFYFLNIHRKKFIEKEITIIR